MERARVAVRMLRRGLLTLATTAAAPVAALRLGAAFNEGCTSLAVALAFALDLTFAFEADSVSLISFLTLLSAWTMSSCDTGAGGSLGPRFPSVLSWTEGTKAVVLLPTSLHATGLPPHLTPACRPQASRRASLRGA